MALCTLALGALVLVSAAVAPQETEKEPPKMDKKQLEAKAREIVPEGEAPEKQGKLAEAKDKYVDAEGIFSTHDALSGIKRIYEAENQKVADTHLSSMDSRRTLYDAGVEEAQEILSDLLLRSLGIASLGTKHKAHLTIQQRRWASGHYKRALSASERLSAPYVERQLEKARNLLEKATDLFPLGVEANELLALVYQEGNDWPAAFRSFDSPAGRNLPVSFYAQVNSAHDSTQVRAAKVEITSNTVRLVYLSSPEAEK